MNRRMKNRYRVFRRGWGTYYCEDLVTKKQETLRILLDPSGRLAVLAAAVKPELLSRHHARGQALQVFMPALREGCETLLALAPALLD